MSLVEPTTIAQVSCPNGTNATEYVQVANNSNISIIQAGVCQYSDPLPLEFVALIFWAAMSIGLYIRTGSVLLPYLLTLIMGSAVLSQVAPIGVTAVVATTLGLGGWLAPRVYREYSG